MEEFSASVDVETRAKLNALVVAQARIVSDLVCPYPWHWPTLCGSCLLTVSIYEDYCSVASTTNAQ